MKRILILVTWIVTSSASMAQRLPLFDLEEMNLTNNVPETQKVIDIREDIRFELEKKLQSRGFSWGDPIYVRIFKKEARLRVYMQRENGDFDLFDEYRICRLRKKLGPKIKEGDKKSPEGFYFVLGPWMNPWSRFRLAYNIGYPNRFDRLHERTGSNLMVHGKCVSSGCFAMRKDIDELYILADAALRSGQRFFRVHIFPFEMTEKNMRRYRKNEWFDFWKNLKEGYDLFQVFKRPPNVEVDLETKRYVFNIE